MKYLVCARIELWRNGKPWDDGSYRLKGRIVDSNISPSSREFDLFAIGGKGLDLNMSAFYDCIELGLVKGDAWIDIGKEKKVRPSEILAQAKEGNDEFFQVFHDKLTEYKDNK